MNQSFWEQQQKMYQDFVQNYFGKYPGMEVYQQATANMAEAMKGFTNPMAAMMPGAATNPFGAMMSGAANNPFAAMKNPWAALSGNNNPFAAMMPSADMFNQFFTSKIPGFELYGKIFEFWKSMENPVDFMKDYAEKYMDLMQGIISNVIPEGGAAFIQKPRELMDTCLEFYKSIMSPWMEIDPSILERIAQGDKKAYVDFFKEVNSKYEETFGKVFNMMGLGLNREKYERQMRAMNLYYKLMFATGELVAMVQNTMNDSMKQLLEKYQALLKDGKNVSTFKEFYELWYKVNEDALTGLFNTDDFSKTFGAVSDISGKYMQAMNDIYEEMLSSLPVPTKTDMDSLYKTVYDMRKDMRDIKKALKDTKAKG